MQSPEDDDAKPLPSAGLVPFLQPRGLSHESAELIRPPRRMRPSIAVRDFLRTEKGPWRGEDANMMLEPLDLLAGRRYQGIVFVGPSRTGKTMTLVIGGLTYVVTCAPADMLIVQMSQDAARDMSRKDIDRAIRYSPELLARLSPRPRDDNVHDKFFRSGMALNLGWPSVTQLSSRTFKYVFVTDYDRPGNRDDVDGEGSLWDLAVARVRTFMSRGKCLAESSPGGEYLEAKWRPSTPHEAPPAQGILSVYNKGTRARWYWKCQHCGEYFEAKPGLDCFDLPPFEELEQLVQKRDLMSIAHQYARIGCPQCGGIHEPEQKRLLNASGLWLHEGETVHADGTKSGERRQTDIASFWQGGCSATYQRWESLLLRYLQGVQTYVRNSDESSLKTTTNTDQAAPYLPRAAQKQRSSKHLMTRAEEWPQGFVPSGVKFLTAAVDVQSSRFVVHVFGWGIGLESWLVDRFIISSSTRPEGERFAAIQPASYPEDWDVLIDGIIKKTYPVHNVPDVQMPIVLVMGDSGGQEGVTTNAYQFWRSLRQQQLSRRFQLVKGDNRPNAPRAQQSWPDTKGRKDRGTTAARGDVPVWMLNVNVIKDGVAGDLGREVVGPGYHHIPKWIDVDYYDEITAETKTLKGWVNQHRARNEAFDLHVYNRAACIALRAEHINWDKPPEWARGAENLPRISATPQASAKPIQKSAPPPARRVRSSGVKI